MGACPSKLSPCLCHFHSKPSFTNSGDLEKDRGEGKDSPNGFREFDLEDLWAATAGFSPERIVSEHGKKAPNVVYRGRLLLGAAGKRFVAIKRFKTSAWPDSSQLFEEARAVWQLRSDRLANLIGCCCDGDERLLVAEFMPQETLAKHLFQCNMSPECVVYSFGTMLLDLLSGKHVPPSHEVIQVWDS